MSTQLHVTFFQCTVPMLGWGGGLLLQRHYTPSSTLALPGARGTGDCCIALGGIPSHCTTKAARQFASATRGGVRVKTGNGSMAPVLQTHPLDCVGSTETRMILADDNVELLPSRLGHGKARPHPPSSFCSGFCLGQSVDLPPCALTQIGQQKEKKKRKGVGKKRSLTSSKTISSTCICGCRFHGIIQAMGEGRRSDSCSQESQPSSAIRREASH
ncbi:hypothetical protein JOL62DRAFT_283883 [Phyllosticta paracitricarpa]|uniref:Uncharacterized protein n=1 Tax=Phyllosticta paracitricarpa TaxID=2016321 RepID=A0ABR1MVX8_9PEZI